MKYQFEDTKVFRAELFAIGTEQNTGKHYLSCVVTTSNRMVDYEQYYELSSDEFALFSINDESAKDICQSM